MLKQTEGSRAMAEAIALSRPEVICAYPITPQTHIVEALSKIVRNGELGTCQYINVESEFAAMSVAIGASAAGARAYTATSSQGLLFMAEAVYNAAGLGLPIVMTIGNRAIGAPINIWNDHSDSMALANSGWIQLYAESNQEAVDLHIQAFRLAEQLSMPVMVCVDGFILTHAYERIDVPGQEEVDAYLPPFEPVQTLDPGQPVTIGAMVGPEAFMEVRYLAHHKHLRALEVIPKLSAEFAERFGRASGGLIDGYRAEDAETVIVALGSVNGTIKDVVDDMREAGMKAGAVKIVAFRPFPLAALRAALEGARRVVVIEKDLALGLGGIVASNVRMALRGLPTAVYTVIAGLGGRDITKAALSRAFAEAHADKFEDPHFLDLDWPAIDRELARAKEKRRSGPVAENILRDLGLVGHKVQ
jgi:pyruvate ferredoxin oxidoreductase alpha subunit